MTTTPEQLHDIRFPGESDEYRRAREELLREELELRERTEAAAEQRRRLPLGGVVPCDYEFREWDTQTGGPRAVKLSQLFEGDKDTLFLYSFMFRPSPDGDPLGSPCPACTSIIDAVAGQSTHLTQHMNLAIAAKVPIERLRAHAYSRGWPDIRMLSSAENAYNQDYHAEAPDGSQWPIATVFTRRDGAIHHRWSSELFYAPPASGQNPRHVDFMWPLWSILDTTPAGRGGPDLDLRLTYE
jgi:predicted dithiol-disulfide oxidoreductase (DUF899 family)